ncbi:5697_t:CDS:1, partial [Scutellospora calospora]
MDENNENSRNIVIEIDLENPSPTLQPASINTYQTHSSSTNNLFNYEDLLTDVPLQTTTDPADRMHESHKPP